MFNKKLKTIEELLKSHENDGFHGFSYLPQNECSMVSCEAAESIKGELLSKQVDKVEFDGVWYAIIDHIIMRQDGEIAAAYLSVSTLNT